MKLTGNNVNVLRPASGTQYGAIGYLRSGTKRICEGTSSSFVQVKWGGTNYSPAFINQDFARLTPHLVRSAFSAIIQ